MADRMKYSRKIFALLLGLVLLCLCFTAAAESSWKEKNGETGFTAALEDEAGLLKADELEPVKEQLRRITAWCNAGFLTSSSGTTGYMEKARLWGNSELGGEYTVFIIDIVKRRIAIYSTDGIYRTIDTGKANTVTDNVYHLAGREEYGACAEKALSQMADLLEGQAIAAPMQLVSNILLALAVAIVLAFLIVSSRKLTEQEISLPTVVSTTVAGLGTVVLSNKLTRKIRHSSSGGGGGGGHGGGGGGGGGHSGGGGGGGSHGF